MKYKLRCEKCGKVVRFNTDADQNAFKSCSCGNTIFDNVEAKLYAVSDMESFTLIGVDETSDAEWIHSTLQDISFLYDNSDVEKKKKIAGIIDKVYLLLHTERDSVYNDLLQCLGKLHREYCEGKNLEAEEILKEQNN